MSLLFERRPIVGTVVWKDASKKDIVGMVVKVKDTDPHDTEHRYLPIEAIAVPFFKGSYDEVKRQVIDYYRSNPP